MTGMKRARSVKFEGIQEETMNQPTDIYTIPFSEMTQEQREAANREHRYRLARDRAVRILGFYFLQLFRDHNQPWDSDNQAEIETVVDSIIEAARNSS